MTTAHEERRARERSDPGNEPLLLTLEHAADSLSISPRSVRRLIDQGHLAPVRIGRALRVPRAELERYIDERITASHNRRRAGPAALENTACQSAPTRTASPAVPIRKTGGHPTSAAMDAELDALLEPPSGKKPPRSSANGKPKRTTKSTGTKRRGAHSRNS